MRFENRVDAGLRLADALEGLRGTDVVVLGLPRGGIPVAYQVARCLHAPLDVLVVRKLGVPWQPELAFGAIGEGGVRVLNEDVLNATRVTPQEQAEVEQRERAELVRRVTAYRAGRPPAPLSGRTVVVVDDGLATGASATVACQVVRGQGAARIVLAVPVAPDRIPARLREAADELVCLETPSVFGSVGAWYRDFEQTGDAEVGALLARAIRPAPDADGLPPDPEVEVPADGMRLAARFALPGGAPAVVAFAHGSGSSRHSPRNQYVAAELNRAGLGTLLLDLLTEDEENDRGNVFDTVLLARRLRAAADWLRRETGLPVSYFGASTGAAACLEAAADDDVLAIVSRGGRPDLASTAVLARVRAPTLLVVGSLDTQVLSLNRLAADRMHCEHRLAVVPGATHLFTEPGTLAAVSSLARDWFTSHLTRPDTAVRHPSPA
ncbi:phosphoribosyltransferase [Streptomyces sp. NPDC006458]|uniref:phosphoribosyltransferase n=1 Tax=Streptomyces sp. NPDC006458 TaxID=3154302 RepID=UPI0033B2829D